MKVDLRNRDRERPKEPFSVTVHPMSEAGEEEDPVEVEFVDPKKLHWTKLALLEEAQGVGALAVVVPDTKQWDAMRRDPELDGAALEWVMNQWRSHFGLGGPGD